MLHFVNKHRRALVISVITISLILFYCIIFTRQKQIEGFEDKYHIAGDEFDKQYVDMYDIVWVDKDMVEFVVKKIDNRLLKKYEEDGDEARDKVKILDCGCGIGYYNNFFGLLGYKSVGVDKSKNMLRKGMTYFPSDKLIRGDVVNYQLFNEKEFSHIYVGDNVLNMNTHKDINKILKNCYFWLRNGGYLIVDLKDRNKLDYFPAKYSQFYIDDKGNKHSFTYFKNFLYDRFYLADQTDDDNYSLYEKVVLSDNRKRVMKRKILIPERNEFVKLIEKNGFKYEGMIEDDSYKNGNGFDMMFFKKIY